MPGDGRTILIAEDDAMLSLSFASTLGDVGYRTEIVSTAAEVIKHARSGDIAAALIDFKLSDGMTGAELFDALAQNGVPIVICSGYSERHLRERLGSREATILGKPVPPKRLVEAVTNAVTTGAAAA